ncbi:hypothetical protein GGS24DRAFT_498501 [Hypoxylon argillaceum]|nr:hypothetical protein GGS24DRAFT_498501 [Hypoxylon argillaceum]
MGHSRFTLPFVALMALIIGPEFVQSLAMEYCASLNTAATATNSSIWQSDGLCHDFCVDQSYAFAIVQAHDCWCSDYVPATSAQVDTDECNDACPGWKYDTCGAQGLYGYIALDAAPSGTADGASTSTSAGQTSTTSVDTSSTATSVVESSTTSTSTTSSTSLPDPTTKTGSTSTTTTTPLPSTSIKTVTAGGTVSLQTVTVTPTPTAGSSAESDLSTSSHGLSTGATVGVVVGVLGAAAILAGIAIFFCLRRRRRQSEELLTSRPQSHLSGSAGMMGTPTTGMASVWDGDNTSSGRRNSRLMPHDPRMDPFATNIYSRFENKSRESINTLQDNQDYSRKVLRTTNPDPVDD